MEGTEGIGTEGGTGRWWYRTQDGTETAGPGDSIEGCPVGQESRGEEGWDRVRRRSSKRVFCTESSTVQGVVNYCREEGDTGSGETDGETGRKVDQGCRQWDEVGRRKSVEKGSEMGVRCTWRVVTRGGKRHPAPAR